jgi:hypothetical protein
LWMRHAPIYSAAGRTDVTILFDGDLRPEKEIPDPETIPASDDSSLAEVIKAFSGCKIDFAIDGGANGGNTDQLHEVQRKFIAWSRANVRFLPGNGCPEQFVLRNLPDAAVTTANTKEAKAEFLQRAGTAYGLLPGEALDGDQLFSYQKIELAKIPFECPDLIALHKILSDFVD